MVKGFVESMHLMWVGDLLDGLYSGDFLNIYGNDCLELLRRYFVVNDPELFLLLM